VTGVLALGAGFGLGLTMLAAWLAPARPSLTQAVTTLHPPITTATPPPEIAAAGRDGRGWLAVVGRPGVPLLARLGLPRRAVAADLAICGREPARHLAEQAATALVGFLTPTAAAGLATAAGLPTGWQLPGWASLAGAAAGLWLPDLALTRQANTRRAQLRDAVAGMLDLTVIALAGGAGLEQALRDATDQPTDWAAHTLRRAVEAAHLTRRPPWHTLGELGRATGVTALAELSAALALAGGEGARIKATLTSRSAALATHQLAEAETAATAATEKMVLPVVALLVGFLIFLGYPAFTAVLQAL
jgi:Flp pilus assembly protein TadB